MALKTVEGQNVKLVASAQGVTVDNATVLKTEVMAENGVNWTHFVSRYGVEDLPSFARVAYIHNATYLGGLVGLIVALVRIGKYGKQLTDSEHGQPHCA
jgi:hypothetical protein